MFLLQRSRIAIALTGLIALGTLTTESRAQVPPASIQVSANGGVTILSAGTVNGNGCNGSAGCENSTATATSGLSVSTSGSNSGSDPANAGGLAVITFYYEVNGPANVAVPMLISGSASTSAFGPDAEGLAYIEYGGGQLYTCSSTITGPCGTESSSGSLNSVSFSNGFTNVLQDLQVIASGSSVGTGSFSAQVSGLSLSIDPAFLAGYAPGKFNLVFSSNITPVPEPSIWIMMLIGIGGIALRPWSKRRPPTFAKPPAFVRSIV